MQRITSRQNAIVTQYRDAARGAVPDTILLDGIHLVGEAVAAGLHLRHLLVAADAIDQPEIARLLERVGTGVPAALGSSPVIDAASPVRSSSAVIALAARPAGQASIFASAAPLVVVVCDVQDPGNVGAILRVAEAAGASGALIAGQSADPFGWKALRGSMGSALRLPVSFFRSVAEAVGDARRHGARVIATVPRGGEPLFGARLDGAVALLIGAEGLGLPMEVVDQADTRVTIPMEPPVESLNAAVAAAILLYEARRQRTASLH